MKMIEIIGICGPKFSGKDTIANHLVKKFGFTKISFGDPLKDALKCIFDFDDEQLWGNKKENVDKYWNVSPRKMLQFIGTDCLRIKMKEQFTGIGDNVWVLAMKKKINLMAQSGITKFVIPDIRFPNEELYVHSIGGIIIRLTRPSLCLSDHHISENLTKMIDTDYVIENTDIIKLFNDIDMLLEKIYSDHKIYNQ